jgi:hypothetical protein
MCWLRNKFKLALDQVVTEGDAMLATAGDDDGGAIQACIHCMNRKGKFNMLASPPSFTYCDC